MIEIHHDWRQDFPFSGDKVIAVSILAIFYTLIFLVGILSYISMRNRNYLGGRQIKMALIQSLGGFIIGIYNFYDYGARYSICPVQLWALHFSSILYFVPVIFNCIRVLYITNMGTEVLKGYAQEESKLFTTTAGKILYHSLNAVYYNKKIKYAEVRKLEFPFWMTTNLRKYQLIARMDDFFFIILMVLSLLMLIIAAIIQAFGVSHRVLPVLDMNNCVVGQDAYFIYSVIILLVLIATPIAVFSVRRIKDNYGIVSEATYVCGINIWFISMYIFWVAVIYPQYPQIYETFPAQGWIIIMTLFSFILSVIMPMKRAFSRSNILLYDREKFNKILLNQPEEWDQFEAGVIADFKFSSLVFELHVQELLEQIYLSAPQNNVLADNFVKGQTYIKYSEVIRLYFCLDSPFCLPLSKSWLDEIQGKLASTKITVGIFDETRNYINDSLFVNTYCRIREFRIAKENSGEFLFSRYLSRLGSKVSKGSKIENQPKTPSVSPVKTRPDSDSPEDGSFQFLPNSSESIYSPYSVKQTEVPSPLSTYGSFSKVADPEKQNRRESSAFNRRSLYPIGRSINSNSVQIDSLLIVDENLPSRRTSYEEDNVPLSNVRDSLNLPLNQSKTAIPEGSSKVTHIMDRKSFSTVQISNTDRENAQNVDSLIKKYQTESHASTNEYRDSTDTNGHTMSGFYSDDSESGPKSRVNSSYYRDSLAGESSSRNLSMVSFVPPPTTGDITDAINPQLENLNLHQVDPETIRDSTISTSTRPYFVIEDGEEIQE